MPYYECSECLAYFATRRQCVRHEESVHGVVHERERVVVEDE